MIDAKVIEEFALVLDALDIEDEDERLKALPEAGKSRFGDYLRWQLMNDEDSEKNISMLADGCKSLMGPMRELRDECAEGEIAEIAAGDAAVDVEDVMQLYAFMLSDLAGYRFFNDDEDGARSAAEEFMLFDAQGITLGRTVFYSMLIKDGEYERAVESADGDMIEDIVAANSRALALYEMQGFSEEASDAMLAAISMDPDMLFYALGFWDAESYSAASAEAEEALAELILLSSVIGDMWSESEERMAFASLHTFAFGYITGRIDDEELLANIEDGFKSLGCIEQMREAQDTVNAMIAAGRDLEAVDEEAILAFIGVRDQGYFIHRDTDEGEDGKKKKIKGRK